jgi:hypothetical protein
MITSCRVIDCFFYEIVTIIEKIKIYLIFIQRLNCTCHIKKQLYFSYFIYFRKFLGILIFYVKKIFKFV